MLRSRNATSTASCSFLPRSRQTPRSGTADTCRGGTSANRVNTSEFIPIYGPRGRRGKEAPALAGGPCTGLQACPPAFLAILSVTMDALQRLVTSCEAALQAQRACYYALYHFRMHFTLWPLII
jgi:hypothetical protein